MLHDQIYEDQMNPSQFEYMSNGQNGIFELESAEKSMKFTIIAFLDLYEQAEFNSDANESNSRSKFQLYKEMVKNSKQGQSSNNLYINQTSEGSIMPADEDSEYDFNTSFL